MELAKIKYLENKDCDPEGKLMNSDSLNAGHNHIIIATSFFSKFTSVDHTLNIYLTLCLL